MIDGRKIRIGCDKIGCRSYSFDCSKIAQTIFCENIHCGGIVGDTLITSNTTTGINCATNILDTVSNEISSDHLSKNKISKGYAYTFDCPTGDPKCYRCFWDNGGWTCDGQDYSIPSNFNDNCYLQFLAPFPNLPPTEKIIISVGTVVGVVTIGVTYYVIRKKRKSRSSGRIAEPNNLPLETNPLPKLGTKEIEFRPLGQEIKPLGSETINLEEENQSQQIRELQEKVRELEKQLIQQQA